MNGKQAAALIDHTLLKAEATPRQIELLCDEAVRFGFATVCINPCHVSLAAGRLKGSQVKVCTVVGFPLGANTTAIKVQEATQALLEGAREVDMVINLGAARAGQMQAVAAEVRQVVQACRAAQADVVVKVILETCLFKDAEKTALCRAMIDTGVNYVKTSTGFSVGGATREDVALMHRAVAEHGMLVKASGGIRTRQALEEMVQAGASRIGTSSGPAILAEYQN